MPKTKSIWEFADERDLTLEIHKRDAGETLPYYVGFADAEVKEGQVLCGVVGDGDTIGEAINDYAKQILGKILAIDAFGDGRETVRVPKLRLED